MKRFMLETILSITKFYIYISLYFQCSEICLSLQIIDYLNTDARTFDHNSIRVG